MILNTMNEVIAEIQGIANHHNAPFLVALDGRSGTGKTTFSELIGKELGAAVILGDNFYSGGSLEEWAPKSPKEKAAYCMDWRRMRIEALEPLLAGRVAKWRTFNWLTGVGLSDEEITCQPAPIIVLDGAFSSRLELSDIVDLSILLRIPDDIRRERLKSREGAAFMSQWHPVWDAGEDYYFENIRPASSFDITVDLHA